MEALNKRILPPVQCKICPQDDSKLSFGDIFSDHMIKMDYYGGAWHNPRIEPYAPLQISPAAMCLHYGQLIFEGLKCFRQQNGKLALFRPEENFKRLNRSAKRLCIPEIDTQRALADLKELLKIDAAWVPKSPGTSLYIRPFIVATEPHLGVRPAREYLYMIVTCPVGAYYASGFGPVKIYVEPGYSRSANGGTGEAKTAGNYAASLYATEEACKKGFSQLLWLDAAEHKYVEEVGSMNMFFVLGDELVTPPLNGTILAGITRNSILTIARDWGLKVSERSLSIDELSAAQKSGELKEAFGAGTAAVISPVGHLSFQGEEWEINGGQTGPLTKRFYDEITGLQQGTVPDTRGWITLVD